MTSDPAPRPGFYSPTKNVPGLTSNFNPKAVQEAAQNPSPKKKLPTGPFIDAVPFGKYHIPAGMSMETHLKKQAHIQYARRTILMLKAARWLMLASRMMQLVAAIGLVVLLVSLRGMEELNGWIMRVPPAVAILHIIYSIYHNARTAKDRAPLSSAGYAVFAMASDCCIIPFYVFICLWTWQQRQQMIKNPMNEANWVTVFDKSNLELNELIVFVVFCTAAAGGGLMVFSVLIGLFIAITFRGISRLPPDMNPLDNSTYTSLTARPSSKRFSKQSTTSVDSDTTLTGSPTKRSVPFLEVRTNNGSLNWEYTKEDAERFNSKSTLDLPELVPSMSHTSPLLPPPHKFGNLSDSRRNSMDTSRSHPNSSGHRKSQSTSYYSDNKENYSEPHTPPRPPRHTYKQRPTDWWSASNIPANLPNAFTGLGNNGQNARYSTLSQSDTDIMSSSSFGDPRSSRNTFGHAPAHTAGVSGTPTHVSSYAGSISTVTAPSVASNGPSGNSPNVNRNSLQQSHMNTPPGALSMGTLGSFATDLAPRPLSFPNNRSNPNSPNHQSRNSISHAVGRMPYSRTNTMTTNESNHSPTKSFTSSSAGVLGSYSRPPPQTSLTPPASSPTKGGVSGGRKVDGFGDNVYSVSSPNYYNAGVTTPGNSAPSSPTKQMPNAPGTPSSVRDKKKKYENLAQNSPGRSTSGEKKKGRVKRDEKERRKSMKNQQAEEREKEASTRVVSNSGADFAHMFGNQTNNIRGRVISGSQVV